jgi:hypothetical protein
LSLFVVANSLRLRRDRLGRTRYGRDDQRGWIPGLGITPPDHTP